MGEVCACHGERADGAVEVLLAGGEGGGLFCGHPVPPAALFLGGGTHTGRVAGGVALGVAGLFAGRTA